MDLAERADYPGPFVQANAAEGLPFADDEFDLVYCSSVIEHVPAGARAAFAGRSAGRARLDGADARLLVPDGAALAAAVRPLAARGGSAGATGGSGAAGGWEDIDRCCAAREMEALFGPAAAERFGPLVKSWVCVSP